MNKVADIPQKPIELFDISIQAREFTLFSIKEPSVKQQQDNHDRFVEKNVCPPPLKKQRCVIL